jgi:uncharacterized membrane protein YgcG
MRRWLLLPLIAALFMPVLMPVTAHADEGWVIKSFDSDITVGSDARLTVVEDIRVDFGAQQKHGIFRTIPLRYHYSDTQDRYYNLTVESVTDGTGAIPFGDSIDSDNELIKIGDPDVLVTGTQRYVITYAVAGALNSFSDHDEIFWNVDGALWPVPKEKVTATIHLPAGAFQMAACYQGAPGSTEACEYNQAGDDVTYTSTRTLESGEEMSVVAGLVSGVVAVPAPQLEGRRREFPQDAFDLNPLTIGLALLVLIGGIGLVVWNWLAHGRDREYLTQFYLTNDPREHAAPAFAHQAIAVEFEPPQKLRPAILGVVLDESADTKDVTATIVDLAVHGYMTITEVPGKKDWIFTKQSDDERALLPYEKEVLDGVFLAGREVNLSDLKGKFGPSLQNAEKWMYAEAMSRRLFTSGPRQSRAEWGCIGIAVVIVGGALAVMLGLAFGWGLLGAAVAIVGLVLTASFPFMPQRTAAGRELMQRALGFRLYMTTAEKYREQFAAKAGIFNELLPYAIVFGCVALWARAFEGIDTSQSGGWYVGQGAFQAALLSSSLETMNANISSAITYTPPSSGSSSGFGGGGFSGGGGGGGGGGSW